MKRTFLGERLWAKAQDVFNRTVLLAARLSFLASGNASELIFFELKKDALAEPWDDDETELKNAYASASNSITLAYGKIVPPQNRVRLVRHPNVCQSGLGIDYPGSVFCCGSYVCSNGEINIPYFDCDDEWEVAVIRKMLFHDYVHLLLWWGGIPHEGDHPPELSALVPGWKDSSIGAIKVAVKSGKPIIAVDLPVWR